MGKVKIHEISKEIGLTSKEILAKAKELGIKATSHLSSIEDDEAKKLKEVLKKPVKQSTKQNSEKATAKKSKETTPVIIRREVIINDDEEKKKEEKKKEEKKRSNDIGFVERKNNDYNIVYRNKQTKPMTAAELFGLKNKENEKKAEKKPVVKEEKVEKTDKIEKTIEETSKKSNEVKAEDVKVEKVAKEEVKVESKNKIGEVEKVEERNMGEERRQPIERRNNNNYNNRDNNFRNNNFRNNRDNNVDSRNNNYSRDNSDRNNNYNNRDNSERNNNYRNNSDRNNNYNNRDNSERSNNYRNNNYNNYNNRDNSERSNNYRNNNYNNRDNSERPNNYRNNSDRNNNYNNRDNSERPNNYRNNSDRNNNYNNRDNSERSNNYRNNSDRNNNFRNNSDRNNNYNNRDNNFRNNNFRNNRDNRDGRALDEKGIDKNIKNIIESEIVEKENVRDYTSKVIDKEKSNRYDENKNSKKSSKSKKSERFDNVDGSKLKDLKQVDKLSHMFNEQDGGMLDYYDLTTARGRKNKKRNNRNEEERTKQKIFKLTEIFIPETITVKDLAAELKKTSAEVIKKLFNYGIMATINNDIDFDTAYLVASEFGVTAHKKEVVKEEDILFDESEDKETELKSRPPVVVVMGHVDHGKTSLLDAIRKTNVIEGEAGGITQHIGAYKVTAKGREITFLDTPGHEAFTSMRARGAQITDIAILVVAANDGVMPQTVEAINHAKAAGIPIVVAVNKIDLPGANVEMVKQELMKYELVPEEWGGDTIYVPISAKMGTNIDTLLEMVLLVADMKELKANPNKQAKGAVIEARLDKAKGPIASVLVQRGTLDVGDTIVVGHSIGRIRAMKNDKGQKVKKAGPSTPVEVMGLTEVPEAGETFYEVKDEKMAKHLIERRKRQEREKTMNATSRVTLNDLFSQIEKGNLKQLNIIVKADVQGSAEAIKQSLEKLSDDEVNVKVIHSIAGGVTESDVQLAKVANAIIIAFNVRPGAIAKQLAEKEEVEIKQYSVIYQAIDDVKAAMKGLLDPIFEEKVIGNVEVRQTFKVSNVGTIAGAYVLSGKVERNAGVRVIRDDVVLHDGKLCSLKRFKDDVKEVAKGFECGMQIENYNDLKEGDIIEVYIMEEVKRK